MTARRATTPAKPMAPYAVLEQILDRLDEWATRPWRWSRRSGWSGGASNPCGWAEVGGKGPDGNWYVLKLRHRPASRHLQAGLLAYASMASGGGTREIGQAQDRYEDDQAGAVERLTAHITEWLGYVEHPERSTR